MAVASTTQPVAVITGASSGIGEALAYELARDGYRLVLVARGSDDLNRVAGVITTKLDVPTIAIPKDLSVIGSAEELDSELASRGLVPDVLINNAGFGLMGRATDLPHDEQLAIIDLNVRATTELSIRCGAAMKKRGRGGIMNISSVAGFLPGPHMAVYYASKAYLTSFTEALSVELKPFGVQVTVVCPGITKTDFQRRAGMENALLLKSSPQMTAEQVARIAYAGFKKGKRVVLTGAQNYFTALSSKLIPNAILLPVVNRLHK
jgi:hypothetical protein